MRNKLKNMSKKTKIITSIVLAVVVFFSIFAIPYMNFNSEDNTEIINVKKDKFFTGKAAYNRGEWLTILSEKFKIDLKNAKNANGFYFNDTENTKYCAVAETFAMYGFIPVTENFEAAKPVTRAYAAYTIAKIMGYESTPSVELLDIKNSFENEISIVVSQGYMSTSNGCFYPDEFLSENEKEQIFNRIDEVNDSATVRKSDVHNKSKFADGVISARLKFVKEYSVEIYENEVLVVMPKNIITNSLKSSDVIVLPQTEEYPNGYALKITSIEVVDDKLVISSIKPEIYEVFETIDVATVVSPDMDDIEVAEGVALNDTLNANLITTLSKDINVDDKVNDPFDEETFDFDEEFENIGLSGKVTVKIPQIEYRMKGSVSFKEGLDCTDFLFKLQNDIETEVNITFEDINIGDLQSQKHEFATIPIPLAYGFAAKLTFYINISADGSVTITNNCSLIAGYQYRNGASRSIFNFEKQKDPPVNICVSGKIGLGCVLNLSFGKFVNLVGYEYEIGLQIEGKVYPNVINKKLVYCSDLSVYFYARSGIDSESALGIFLELYDIEVEFEHLKADESNPWWLNFHFENNKLVAKCSYYEDISTNVKVYSEDEVKSYFNSLLNDYSAMELMEIFGTNDKNFSEIDFNWLLRDSKYTKYILDNSNDFLFDVNRGETRLTIADIMNEEEKTRFLKDSAQYPYRSYKVYNITDIDEVISTIWRPGRFKVNDLHTGDFNVNFVTSKGYLVSPATEFVDYYGEYFGKYISYKQIGKEYRVKAYLIETPDNSLGVTNYFKDCSTGRKIGKLQLDFSESLSDFTFDEIITESNINKADIVPVEFVFEGTSDGLRFKSYKNSVVTPDKKLDGNITKTVIADGGLNLRTEPNTESIVIALVPQGDFVWCIGESKLDDDWVFVNFFDEKDFQNYNGWVNKKYLN